MKHDCIASSLILQLENSDTIKFWSTWILAHVLEMLFSICSDSTMEWFEQVENNVEIPEGSNESWSGCRQQTEASSSGQEEKFWERDVGSWITGDFPMEQEREASRGFEQIYNKC